MDAASSTPALPTAANGPARRDGFAQHALALIPSIISQQDRDPHSPTYGCFDADYWHRRSIDFPSGSAAEAVLPLALAYSLDVSGNPFHREPALKAWIEAGIRYPARSTHPDGSCDDRFPFDKSPGATAAALLACLDAYALLGIDDTEMLQFFTRRADWLAAQRDHGRDSTPLALAALSLEKAGHLLGTDRWEQATTERIERLLRLQDEEGWFPERKGADPGCDTFVLGLLAQLHLLAPSHALRVALTSGIAFAAEFLHPDGSFGGEYGSVGTPSLFPHGFEIAGQWLPGALAVDDQFLPGLLRAPDARDGDRRLLTRRCWSYLLAWQNWVAARPAPAPRATGRRYFKNAGLLIDRRDGCELYVALNRGGVFKLWRDGALVASDTQLSVQMQARGKFSTAVANQIGHHRVQLDGHTIAIRGKLVVTDQRRTSTPRLIFRRILMATAGRLFPNLARARCATHRDTSRKSAPFRFTRSLAWSNGRLHVTDELHAKRGWESARSVGIGAFQSGACAQPTRIFEAAQLQPWQDFTERTHELKSDEPLKIERVL